MNALIEKIQSSLLNLIGVTIESLPAIVTAVVILFVRRYATNFAQQFATKVGKRTIKSQSLQLLLARTSSVTAWVLGILTACVFAFPILRLGDIITPLSEAAKLLQETIMGVEGILSDPEPEIDLVSFGDSSLNFAVRYWTLPQQRQVRQVKTRAIVALKKTCDRAGINSPYPIRTLYFYDQQEFDDISPASPDGTSK